MNINKLIDKYIENDVDIMQVHIDVLYEYARDYNKLQQENKQLKKKIKDADEFCDRYMGVYLELFDMYGLLNTIREILGDKE